MVEHQSPVDKAIEEIFYHGFDWQAIPQGVETEDHIRSIVERAVRESNMMKLSLHDRNILNLIGRSMDCGDGWRYVSASTWSLIEQFRCTELIEKDVENSRVRMTQKGLIVFEYLVE